MGGSLRGPEHPSWRGGRIVASNGYVRIWSPDHPDVDAGGYVYEHRLVAEQMLGRRLRHGEQVHHANEIKTDNRPENLVIVGSYAEHAVHHRKRQDLRLPDAPNPLVGCGCGCGASFPLYDAHGRPRRSLPGHSRGLRSPSAPCACGCGQMTSRGRRYAMGHNSRTRPHPAEATTCACGCGESLDDLPRHRKDRRYRPGHHLAQARAQRWARFHEARAVARTPYQHAHPMPEEDPC